MTNDEIEHLLRESDWMDTPRIVAIKEIARTARAALQAAELAHAHWEECEPCQDEYSCETFADLFGTANVLRWKALGIETAGSLSTPKAQETS